MVLMVVKDFKLETHLKHLNIGNNIKIYIKFTVINFFYATQTK